MKTFSPLVRLVEQAAPGRKGAKSAQAFRTISEVALELDVPQHVLRFWETKFSQIRPLKRGGGRRYYRPDDVALLRSIHKLLHHDGYTIKGVQRLLKEAGRPAEAREIEPKPAPPGDGHPAEALSYSMLDLFDEETDDATEEGGAPELVSLAADEGGIVPLLPVLNAEKRAQLRSVLAELEELRALIPPRLRSLAS